MSEKSNFNARSMWSAVVLGIGLVLGLSVIVAMCFVFSGYVEASDIPPHFAKIGLVAAIVLAWVGMFVHPSLDGYEKKDRALDIALAYFEISVMALHSLGNEEASSRE